MTRGEDAWVAARAAYGARVVDAAAAHAPLAADVSVPISRSPNSRALTCPDHGAPRRRQGSALVVVLWTIGLMALLVSSFAFDAHLEARVTSYYRKRTRASYLAESGVDIAKLLMAKSATVDPRGEAPPGGPEAWLEESRQLAGGKAVSVRHRVDDDSEIWIDIVTELARRNVSSLKTEELWEPVLEVGNVPPELWPELVESFLDWIDSDDDARVDGAETEDYYETLERPYKARNGNLYSVEELLLIKGFTRAIVYGGILDPESDEPVHMLGIADLLTVFGDVKVNVNAASLRVLMTLPDPSGDADLVAEAVLAERERPPEFSDSGEPSYFTDDQDMFRRVPELAVDGRREFVTTGASRFYRITSRGRVLGVERKVSCIVQNDGSALTILRWIEDN